MKQSVKAVLLPLVFLITFFTVATPKAHADYSNYLNLFTGLTPNQNPSLKIVQIFRPSASNASTPVFDFKFNFQAAFSLTSDHDAKWHLNLIRDGEDASYLLRICDVNETGTVVNPDTCIFSNVPSAIEVKENDVRINGDTICKNVNGATRCTLPSAGEAWTKIYSTTTTVERSLGDDFLSSGDPRTQFNVIFGNAYNSFETLGGQSVNLADKFKIGDPTSYKADIWYCGAGAASGENRFTQQITDSYNKEMVNTFNGRCKGELVYFKIAQTENFQMPTTVTAALNTTPIDPTGGSTANTNVSGSNTNLPECSMTGGTFGSGSFMGCVALAIYHVIYRPVAWFAGILGNLFDFFLGYSLSDASYRAEFAVRGWQIVRDISNIFFIIILVYTGLMAVFSTGTNIKRVVSQLILNALLINFSLFGTRVIIDISNVVARVFYKSVQVCEGECKKDSTGKITNPKQGIAGYTPLSEKIVSAFNPQRIFSPSTLSSATALPDNGSSSQGTTKTLSVNDAEYAGYFVVVSLIAAFILFAVAMMFWKTAFFFVGRVIGLYLAMIFAPFAVLTRGGMPLLGGIKDLSWDTWTKDLIQYATLAPIFVFFLYIIYSFLETDFIKVFADRVGGSFFETVVYIAIPMIIVYFMIKQGVSIAEKSAGTIGKQISSFVEKTVGGIGGVIGGSVGIAAGGAAFLGRNTIGRSVRAVTTKTDWGKRLQTRLAANADSNWFARQGNKFINKTQTGSFDARNLGIKVGGKEYTASDTFNKGIGLLGATVTDKFSKNLGIGQDKALGKGGKAGGVKKLAEEWEKKRAENIAKNINYSHLSDSQAKEVWEKKKADAIKKYGEANWEDHVEGVAAIKALKEALEVAQKATKAAQDANSGSSEDNLKVSRAQSAEQAAKNAFESAKVALIKDIKEGRAATEKAEAEKIAGEDKKKHLDVYGNVKSVKALEAAMRAEYAEDLRSNSFWMKDGKPRYITAAMQATLGATLAAAIPGIGTVIGGAMLAAAIDGVVNNNKYGHVVDRATNKLINDAKKAQGRGNAERQLTDKIDELKKKVIDAAKKYGGTSDKFDDYEISDLEDAILKRSVDIDDEIQATTDKYQKRRLQKLKKDLESALEEIEKKQDKLDKMKADKEKKESGEDKNKPKDGGK